jgi:transposase
MRPDAATLNSALPDDAALPDDPETLKGMIRELLDLLHRREHELDGVRQRLDQLLRRLYGPKGERFRADQPALFDLLSEAEGPLASAPPAETESSPPPATKKKRKGHGRRRLPADLTRERIVHAVSESEKVCPCCSSPRVKIGEETSEQLDYRPAKLFVWEHVRLKYACPKCLKAAAATPPADHTPASSGTASSLIVVAEKPAQPIDKGLPGPGLLAHVVVSKYSDHLPLHRQEAILARQGVELSRSTLCDWMAATAALLLPLYRVMLADVLQSRVVQTDETRVPVREPRQDRTKSGRLWVYVGDRDHPHTVYDYTPTKARDGPAAILKDYRGFLQADAANVFDGFYLPGGIVEVGCWAHARRYFHDARDSDAARAAEALARIREFYAIESEARDTIARDKMSNAEADALRLKLRQEQTKPKLDAFAAWRDAQANAVLPKSPMGQAIAYSQRHGTALVRFTDHGFLNIDNNASERALRAVAVGRKNWLFAGSDAGGQTAAVLYTLTQTCRSHGIDPFAYLHDVLTRLPSSPPDDLSTLVPHRWAASQRTQAESNPESNP